MQRRSAALLVALLGCSSGGDKDDDTVKTTKPTATSTAPSTATGTATAQPTATSSVKIDGGDKIPGVEPRVKAEVDNRADGLTGGTPLAATGAKAALMTAKEWTTTKGDITTAASADKKASIAAGAGGSEKAEATATALGLSGCKWNPPESLTVGKEKLSGSGADGLCTKNGAEVKAAMVVVTGENLIVVGAWETGGDDKNLFGAMRSIERTKGGPAGGLAACCRALEQNSVSAPPDKKGAVLLALGACKAALSNPDTAAGLRAVQAAAKGFGLPVECK